jgi:hypothetical protein
MHSKVGLKIYIIEDHKLMITNLLVLLAIPIMALENYI